MADLSKIYRARFEQTGLERRNRVWAALCRHFFSKRIPGHPTVLDLACGYGEFINNIAAREKLAVDYNPDAARHLAPGVKFLNCSATDLPNLSPEFVPTGSVDVVFTSNFLEHLRDKAECDAVLRAVLGLLKTGGRFVIMGPNIHYAYREYWDFYDHYLPLSHLSLAEGLMMAGDEIEEKIPRFLPFSMNNRAPTHERLIQAYLALPIAWRFLGKQFLITARKP